MEEETKQNNKPNAKLEVKQNNNIVKLRAIRKVGLNIGDVLGDFEATQEEINKDERLKNAINSGYVIKI